MYECHSQWEMCFKYVHAQILHIYYTKYVIFILWGAFLFGQFFSLIGFLWALLRIHLLRVQVSMPRPGILSWTALTMKVCNLFPLIILHPSCPTNTPPPRPPSLHSYTWRRLITSVISPFFTSDPSDTRITALIPAPPNPQRVPPN